MNYTGEILHGKWDGARYYMLDDGDCYTPERLADEYKAEFLDAEPNARAKPGAEAEGRSDSA
jgi:hypothetical protein